MCFQVTEFVSHLLRLTAHWYYLVSNIAEESCAPCFCKQPSIADTIQGVFEPIKPLLADFPGLQVINIP